MQQPWHFSVSSPRDYITYSLYSLPSSAQGFISFFSPSFSFFLALFSLPSLSFYLPSLLSPSPPFHLFIYLFICCISPGASLRNLNPHPARPAFTGSQIQARETALDFHQNSACRRAPFCLSKIRTAELLNWSANVVSFKSATYAPSVLTRVTISGLQRVWLRQKCAILAGVCEYRADWTVSALCYAVRPKRRL